MTEITIQLAVADDDGMLGGEGGTQLNPAAIAGGLPVTAVIVSPEVGHPTTGTWAEHQAIVDLLGDVWTCTAGGTPGTWEQGASGSASLATGTAVTGATASSLLVTNGSNELESGPLTDSVPLPPEAIHYVGADGEPAFLNGSNLSGSTPAGFWMDAWGMVELCGFVTDTGGVAPIFTLPDAYWPIDVVWDAGLDNAVSGVGPIKIDPTTGDVSCESEGGSCCLDGIRFRSVTIPPGGGFTNVQLSGTPEDGDIPIATSPTTAIWGANPATLLTQTLYAQKNLGMKADLTWVSASITEGEAAPSGGFTGLTSVDVGKGAYIAGAGASGVDLLTTISSVTDGVPTFADEAGTTVSDALGAYGTDNAPLLQAGIDTILGTGSSGLGGEILVEDGEYGFFGALQTTDSYSVGGYKSQVTIPFFNYTTDTQKLVIRGGQNQAYSAGAESIGAIFTSLLSGLTVGPDSPMNIPALFAGPAGDWTGWNDFTFTGVAVEIENLCLRTLPDAGLSGLNFRQVAQAWVDGVRVDTHHSGAVIEPTLPCFALVMPCNNNNTGCGIGRFHGYGIYAGVVDGEHVTGGNIEIDSAIVGFVPTPHYHASIYWYLSLEDCVNPVSYVDPHAGVQTAIPAGGPPAVAPISVMCIDFEEGPSGIWQEFSGTHINDSGDIIHGVWNYHRVIGGAGASYDPWTIDGGTNIVAQQV